MLTLTEPSSYDRRKRNGSRRRPVTRRPHQGHRSSPATACGHLRCARGYRSPKFFQTVAKIFQRASLSKNRPLCQRTVHRGHRTVAMKVLSSDEHLCPMLKYRSTVGAAGGPLRSRLTSPSKAVTLTPQRLAATFAALEARDDPTLADRLDDEPNPQASSRLTRPATAAKAYT
jgi:hypothetical protein